MSLGHVQLEVLKGRGHPSVVGKSRLPKMFRNHPRMGDVQPGGALGEWRPGPQVNSRETALHACQHGQNPGTESRRCCRARGAPGTLAGCWWGSKALQPLR